MDPQKLAHALVQRLLAEDKLVLASSYDAEHVPVALAKTLDVDEADNTQLAADIAEQLTDLDAVVDLYASDEEIAAMLGELRADED